MDKKRIYSEEYLKFGFTSIVSNGTEKPQCVLSNVVLSAESLKPSKLKRDLETKHSNHVSKDLEFFRHHEASLKHQRLDFTGSFQQENAALVQASYEVTLEIAKNKKPHTIGESLIIAPSLLKQSKYLWENLVQLQCDRYPFLMILFKGEFQICQKMWSR